MDVETIERMFCRASPDGNLANQGIGTAGFVRVALLGKYIDEMATAKKVIAGFVPGRARLSFVSDASRVKDLPGWVKTAAAVADGRLLNVAEAHGARLATMDEGIPGALVI